MDTLEAALFRQITTDAAMVAIFGTRVYPLAMPQNPTYPAVVYTMVGGTRTMHTRGPSAHKVARVEFAVYDRGHAAAVENASKLQARLLRDWPTGTLGADGSHAGIPVNGILDAGDRDGFDDDLRVYVRQFDVLIHHEPPEEPAPPAGPP